MRPVVIFCTLALPISLDPLTELNPGLGPRRNWRGAALSSVIITTTRLVSEFLWIYEALHLIYREYRLKAFFSLLDYCHHHHHDDHHNWLWIPQHSQLTTESPCIISQILKIFFLFLYFNWTFLKTFIKICPRTKHYWRSLLSSISLHSLAMIIDRFALSLTFLLLLLWLL